MVFGQREMKGGDVVVAGGDGQRQGRERVSVS